MTALSTLYRCDLCGTSYQGSSTGGVCVWSWAGMHQSIDLCPECVARVQASIDELKTKPAVDAATS